MTRAVDIEGRGVRVNGRSVGVGSAIPDSELPQTQNRWVLDSGSGTSWRDAVGSSPASANFENWVSGNFLGGYKSVLDGTDDKADSGAAPPSGSRWLSATIDIGSQPSSFQIVNGIVDTANSAAGDNFIQLEDSGEVRYATKPTRQGRLSGYRPESPCRTVVSL